MQDCYIDYAHFLPPKKLKAISAAGNVAELISMTINFDAFRYLSLFMSILFAWFELNHYHLAGYFFGKEKKKYPAR